MEVRCGGICVVVIVADGDIGVPSGGARFPVVG